MKTSRQLVLLVALTAILVSCTKKMSSAQPARAYEPGQVMPNQFVFGGNREPVDEYLREKGIIATVDTLSAEDRHYWVKYKGDVSVGQIVADLDGKTEFVEPNFVVHTAASMRKAEWPTDRMFFKQWAMNNIGQSAPYGLPGKRDADLDVMRAWNKGYKGSKEIIVAVIDTGCDYTHPDLKENIWVNKKESPAEGGIPGKDDDGNGYIDDVYGYDFTSSDRTEFAGVPGDSDPMDESGHGTHCSGNIGAKPNDGMGVAGVNWDVRIMCVRFLGQFGGTSVDSYRAIRYARENGAHIMSNSWGSEGQDSQLFNAEVRKVQEKGILFVVAAGNNGTNNDIKPFYPANMSNLEFRGKKFDNVISVAASDNQDAPADFTNYGHESVDVFAPGVAILSTYPQSLTAKGRPPYAIMSGTSMAAPYVSGVAAMMMAANPALKFNAPEVIRLIKETVDVNETLIGKVSSNGRINAYKAVTAQVDSLKVSPTWQTKAHSVNQVGFNTELVDIRHEIKVEGATAVKVHFDFIQIQEPYDSIYLYDKNYRLVTVVEKTEVDDLWSPAVPGDTVYVRFVNSLLQQIKSMPLSLKTEAACMSRGAIAAEKVEGEFKCNVDAEAGGGDGSVKFTSFNSEGFSIDQVAYITEPLQASTDSRKE